MSFKSDTTKKAHGRFSFEKNMFLALSMKRKLVIYGILPKIQVFNLLSPPLAPPSDSYKACDVFLKKKTLLLLTL